MEDRDIDLAEKILSLKRKRYYGLWRRWLPR